MAVNNTFSSDDSKHTEIDIQEQMLKQYNLLKSIAEIYNSLHEIDLINNTTVPYHARDKVAQIVDHKDGADLMMKEVMIATVDPDYLEAALLFTDLTTLSERMKDKKMISIEIKGKDIGWFSASFIKVEQDDKHNATKVVFTTRIIEDIKQKEERLIVRSNTDELTGVYNRRAYEETVSELNKNGMHNDFVYISIDVNGLKVVNDTIGHNAGDELIVGACSCLTKSFGKSGMIFRMGGDEFAVLLTADDKQLKKQLMTLDKNTKKWRGKLIKELTISYGYVTRAEEPKMSIRDIAILADKKMYQAKSQYYSSRGVDRRGQKDAHTALCSLYTKILKINLSDDSYQIIDIDPAENTNLKKPVNKLSAWIKSFSDNGLIHPDDLPEYLEKTDATYIKDYFAQGKTTLHIFYRRKYTDTFKQTMLEIIPANDYSSDNPSFFLYVKNIDR